MNGMELRPSISLEREKLKKCMHMKDNLIIQICVSAGPLPYFIYLTQIKI